MGLAFMKFLNDSKKKYENIVFVYGPPRSGTTLLNILLSDGNNHKYFPECNPVTGLIRLYNDRKYMSEGRYEEYIRNDKNAVRIYSAAINEMLSVLLKDEPRKKHLILKDPQLIMYSSAIEELFPRSRQIAITRNPYSIISSQKAVYQKLNRQFIISERIAQLKKEYSQVLLINKKARTNRNLCIVSYELLCSNPDDSIKKLEQFLGQKLHTHGNNYKFNTSSAFYSNLYGKSISDDRLNTRDNLTNTEIEEINDHFAAIQEKLDKLHYLNL